MEKFGCVGILALHSQKNFESRGSSGRRSSGRNCHRTLLSQMVAGLRPVAVNELLRSHATLAFELNLEEFQSGRSIFILAAANDQARPFNSDFSGHQFRRT